MTRFLNPRAVYLAGLGLLAVTTIDVWQRVRKRDTSTAVTQEVAISVPAVTPSSKPAAKPAPAPKPAPKPKAKAKAKPQSATTAPVATTTPVAAATRTVSGDDLTKLTGIGPTYAKRLKDAGLTTFADVANASAAQLQEITRATGSAADPVEWIREARALKG